MKFVRPDFLPVNDSRNVVIFTLSGKPHYRAKMVTDNEVVCGPDCEDRFDRGRFLSIKTPGGVYPASLVLDKLPASQKPELIVVKVDATCRNFPVYLPQDSCPKVLFLGDTQHMNKPLQSVLPYALQENFDYIITDHNRHHFHFFASVFDPQKLWAILEFNIHPQPVIIPDEKQKIVSFVGQAGNFHPYRHYVIDQIASWNIPFRAVTAPQITAAKYFAESQINLNISLNGDLNLRICEVISSGGFLITDRLSQQSGLDDMFVEDEHLVYFDDLNDLRFKIDFYLKYPEKALEIAQHGFEHFWKFHNPDSKIRQLLQLVDKGNLPENQNINSDSRAIHIRSEGIEKLETRLVLYEFVQELQRISDNVSVLALPGVPDFHLCDLTDLNRVILHRSMGEGIPGDEGENALQQCGLENCIKKIPNGSDQHWDLIIITAQEVYQLAQNDSQSLPDCERVIIIFPSGPDPQCLYYFDKLGYKSCGENHHFYAFESPQK